MNICVFCSSSENLDEMYRAAARDLGREIAAHGHTVVFGGYDMGLMGETARAALSRGGYGIGITTAGLTAKGRSVVSGIEEFEEYDLSARKEHIISISDAFITLPGGLGTFDEFFRVISRVKAGELGAPCALLDVDGFFHPLADLLDDSEARGLNSCSWRDLCGCFDDAESLIEWLETQVEER